MKLLDSDGRVNHIVPFSNGALRPPHVKQIGPAYPLFLKYEDLVTTGAKTDGIVLGGKPVTDEEIANMLGLHPKTVGAHRQRLERYDYITTNRTPRGLQIRVRKSKKLLWFKKLRSSDTATSQNGDGVDPLPLKDRNDYIGRSRTTTSNKDRTVDSTVDGSPTQIFKGEHLVITERQHQRFAIAFPRMDLDQQYREMDSWLEANPGKRPKNYGRFAHHWLKQELNHPSMAASQTPQQTQDRRKLDDAGKEKLRKLGYGGSQ